MRVVVQRVREARVEVDGEVVGAIGAGLVAFVGAGRDDTERDAVYVADKVAGLRVFEDDAGKMWAIQRGTCLVAGPKARPIAAWANGPGL